MNNLADQVEIRALALSDLTAVMQLKTLAGWNQTEADWRRVLAHDPAGCYAAWVDGRLVGTATSTAYGTELAWIGMVLVDPAFRRRGIATALMRAVLHYLNARGVQTIKLDATAAGRPVYAALGFVEESLIERWEGVAPFSLPLGAGREMTADDWPQVLALDRRAFGAARAQMLISLRAEALTALVLTEGAQLSGFALARSGSARSYLGPLVATTEAAAQTLLDAALSRLAGQPVFIDLNAQLSIGREWLTARSFTKQRDLLRMRWGRVSSAGTSPQILAVAGLEIG